MRKTIRFLTIGLTLAASCLGLASQASALTVLAIGDSHYLGRISPGTASPDVAADNINTLLDQALGSGPTLIDGESYTRSNVACALCPDATDTDSTGSVGESPSNEGIDVSGYTYLLAKYDASQAGAYVWYVGDIDDVVNIPLKAGTCGSDGCGLSHWTLFNPFDEEGGEEGGSEEGGNEENPVPEPASLLLLGGGLSAAALRARAGRAKRE